MSSPLLLVACLSSFGLALSLVALGALRRQALRLRRQLDASALRFQELLETDELTGLLNRRGALHAGDRLLAARGRLHVVVVDVDRLQSVNDAHGYEVGDQVLWTIAGRMGSLLRGSQNALARVGGGRFVALLAAESPAHALATAERLRQSVRRSTTATTAGRLSVTVSVGLAASQAGDGFDDVLERAAAGLDAARAGGRDRVVVQGPSPVELPSQRRSATPAGVPVVSPS